MARMSSGVTVGLWESSSTTVPDRAIRFDLEGNAVELFDRAYRPGVVQFAIGGRVISPGELFSVTETTR